jgi:phosphoribosyl-ATP pyrophosphohydrolase/phosphoribosyl-AMP cyclohydrolase/histidinol dehydrogenase
MRDMDEVVGACEAIAPEHLQLMCTDAYSMSLRVRNYGALFIGSQTAEVLGDYGAGPNHVLPTAGTARFAGGLSVLTFLRLRTWLRIDHAAAARETYGDAAWLARVEGLEAHARAADRRAIA